MVKSNVRTIALVALLSAVSVAGRIALAAIPGFQPTTVIVIVTTMALGLKNGLLVVVVSTLLSNLNLGHGIWTFFQLFAWMTVALLSYFFGRSRFKKNIWISSAFAGLMGILYGMVVSLNGLLFTNRIVAYYLAGLPHDLIHAIGNVVIYFIIGERLLTLLEKFNSSYY